MDEGKRDLRIRKPVAGPTPTDARVQEKRKIEIEQLIEAIQDKLGRIKVKILVMSGKGGVGKTFVSTSLALYLRKKGYRVGLYDADETGAAVPYVMGERKAEIYKDQETNQLIPVTTRYGIKLMSIEPLLPSEETPLVWQGPLRSRFLIETLALTDWSNIDILVIDLPPGTGDEAITLAQVIPPRRYSLIVSSPGALATNVVKKAIVFANKMNIPIIGLIENMSYFRCPGGEKLEVLGKTTAEELSFSYDIPVLGKIPLDHRIRESHDKGIPIFELAPNSELDEKLNEITDKLIESLKSQGAL